MDIRVRNQQDLPQVNQYSQAATNEAESTVQEV